MNIPLVEEALDCNIYVVNLVETMLGSCCINLWEALMYKSHYREKEQHWLLFDRNHYHVITNIRGFLAVRHFCNLCFKCSDKKGTHERHQCKAKEGPKDNGSTIKDISHYLRAEYCKGSKAELSARLSQVVSARTAAKVTQQIKNPKYIIYDFETDTHTDLHVPNHCEVAILQVDDTHVYAKSLKQWKTFSGYGCDALFCDRLFHEDNDGSTVIAQRSRLRR